MRNQVEIRKFLRKDIPLKVEWVNNSKINRYLHYDLPLELEKTYQWFERAKGSDQRFDMTILYNGQPVGLVGLLTIDYKNKKAEMYIMIGEIEFQGKHIAKRACQLILDYAFQELSLNRIYAYVETENIASYRLFESLNFQKEGCLRHDLLYRGKFIDRYILGLNKVDLSDDSTK